MPHLGATGHLDHHVWTAGPCAAIRASTASIDGGEQALVFEIEQGLEIGVSLQHHISAMAAVSA